MGKFRGRFKGKYPPRFDGRWHNPKRGPGGGGAAGGAPAYTTTASDYDGTNDYATLAGGIGGTSNKTATVSFWFRDDAPTGSDCGIISLASPTMYVYLGKGSFDRFQWRFAQDDGTTDGLDFVTANSSKPEDSNWHHFIASVDMSNTSNRHVYVDGSDVTSGVTWTHYVDAALDWDNTGSASIGSYNASGLLKHNGCLSELWMTNEYIDLSVAANLAKFIADGKPVSLGADGSTPTGTQPLVYVPDGDPSTNAGSSGNFTITGALDACSSSPTD